MICLLCKNDYEKSPYGNFCSSKCYYRNRYSKSRVEITCVMCGNKYYRSNTGKSIICRSCIGKGKLNPNWKGGFRYWKHGRYGHDKAGLSWKTQRKLAWERDKYTCQICGISPKTLNDPTYKPDVHHLIPYRISYTHHIDNLISLCHNCHMKEEYKDIRKWSGNFLHNRKTKKYKQACKGCI